MAPRKTKAAATKSQDTLELEAKLAAQMEQTNKLLEAFQRSENEKAVLSNMLARQTPQTATSAGGVMVGVRNVSNYTIALTGSPLANEEDICLHAEPVDGYNPSSSAIVSWVWWQKLRKSKLFGFGMFVRDDSLLDPNAPQAPVDQPHELHPDHYKNLVLDARAFIEDQPESQLRAKIAAMTTEEPVRRLLAEVDRKVGEAQAQYPEDDEKRAEKAVMSLPSIYQLAENLLIARLADLDTKDPF